MLVRKTPEVADGRGDSRFDITSKGAFATPGVLAAFSESEVHGVLEELATLGATKALDYLQVFKDGGRVLWVFDQGEGDHVVLCLPSEY